MLTSIFYYVLKNKFLVFFDITSATKRVSTSAAGNASHTPVIPRNFGRINANAMMDQSNAKQTNAIMNITSLLAQYLPYLAKSLNIEWDTGGVAAKLARDMDRELGILAEEGVFL